MQMASSLQLWKIHRLSGCPTPSVRERGSWTPGDWNFCPWAAREGKKLGTFQFTAKEEWERAPKDVRSPERWKVGGQRRKGRGEACQTGWKLGENRRVNAGQNVCIHLRAGSVLSSLKKAILRHWKNSIFITALMTFPLSARFSGEIHLQGNFFLSAVRRPDKETQLNVLFSAMQMLFHNTNKINIFLWDTKFSESWVYLWRFLAMLCLVAKLF